jgi:hypothetical protein
MAKTSDRHTLSDKIFGFLRDWLSQSKAEFRLIMENVRLRREIRQKDIIIGQREEYIRRLEKMVSDTYREGQQKIKELSQALHDALEQKAKIEQKFFECRGKSDAAERSQE